MRTPYEEYLRSLQENPMWIGNQMYADDLRYGMMGSGCYYTDDHVWVSQIFESSPAYMTYMEEYLLSAKAERWQERVDKHRKRSAQRMRFAMNMRTARDPYITRGRQEKAKDILARIKEGGFEVFFDLLREYNAAGRNGDSWTYRFVEKILQAKFKTAWSKHVGYQKRFLYASDEAPQWKHVPWSNRDWWAYSGYGLAHLAHISTTDPTMLSYCPNVNYLMRDRFIRVKPGKYLTQFFSNTLNPHEIKTLAERWERINCKDWKLNFVENDDPDGWVRVYDEGPSSCMAGEDCVRIYAYPGNGLRLAYMTTQSGDTPMARAIVRDDKRTKGYLRIYPSDQTSDDDRTLHIAMRQLLEAEGYGEQINLDGVKVRRIWKERYGSIVMPYIDRGRQGSQSCSEPDDYDDCVELGEGTYECCSQSGYIEVCGRRCECACCGDRIDEDDAVGVNDELFCQSCLDEHYTYAYVGRHAQEYVRNDDAVYCEDTGEHYLNDMDVLSHHNLYYCDISGDLHHMDNLVRIVGDRVVHMDYAVEIEEYGGFQFAHKDEAIEWADGSMHYMDDEEPQEEAA